MILIITNKDDITTDYIVTKLRNRNLKYFRLNTETVLSEVTIDIDINSDTIILTDSRRNETYNLSDVSSVYFRRPAMPNLSSYGLPKEEVDFTLSEINHLLEGVYKYLRNRFWVSSVYSIREAENKIYQLLLAKSMGFIIPSSSVTMVKERAEIFVGVNKDCIIKPISAGFIRGKNEKVIFTNSLEDKQSELVRVAYCPTLFQNRINKTADVRVTTVGKRLFAAKITSPEARGTPIDWREIEDGELKYERITIPTELEEKCVRFLRKLNLNFGAFDFALEKNGNFIFLELNPNGQWAWIERRLGYDISGEIVSLLVNCKN